MKIRKTLGYCFDDLLLVPKYSEVKSRNDVDNSVYLGKDIKLEIPIVSANMKNVTGIEMARTISQLGGLALLHRFTDNRLKDYRESLYTRNIELNDYIGISVGVADKEKNIIDKFAEETELKVICVDIAHGDHISCVNMVHYINKKYPKLLIIAGNVATAEGAKRLADVGADVVKASVGSGALCSTRIQTGNGVPTMQAVMDIHEWRTNSNYDIKLIGDGGIKNSGDITKCLCFADAVMLGSLLAGTNEAPGEIITIKGKQYKTYAGSSTHKTNHIEGVTGLAPTKGEVINVVRSLMEGVRSGMSYQGVDNLTDLKKDPEFIEVTSAGHTESKPHSVMVQA